MRLLIPCVLLVTVAPDATAQDPADFGLTIEDAFRITGRGVAVTGVVRGGPVAVDDIVCLRPQEGEGRELTVIGIERFRAVLDVAEPGMAVALLFDGIELEEVAQGDVLTASCQ